MSAELLRRLIEAGTPAELVAEVAMLAGEVSALEKRREADRARQQAHRERVSRDVTLGHAMSRDVTDTPPPPDKSPPDPQKLTPTPVPAGRVIPARARFAPPEGVSGEQWGAFLGLRTAKRQPMTDRGYSLLCGKLRTIAEHGFPPGEMIDLAIERGWTTVHEPKDPRNGRDTLARDQSPDGLGPTARAAMRAFPDAFSDAGHPAATGH